MGLYKNMNKHKRNALIFKAFCDENRLRIIDLIKVGETCSCVLLEDLTISQSTLSHHMKILIESGLVKSRKEGKYSMYSLSIDTINESKKILDDILQSYNSSSCRSCKSQNDKCKTEK